MASSANFTFDDVSKFYKLEDIIDEKTKLPVIILPINSEIYRADRDGAREPSERVPAFFTNIVTTRGIYSHGKNGTISSYIVKKPARLFHMNLNSIIDLYFYIMDLYDKDEVNKLKYKMLLENYYNPEELVVNPTGYMEGDTFPNYLNRRMAQMICHLGFDGWVVKPFNPEKKTGLKQWGVLSGVNDYPPEIMLCRWKSFMDLKSLPIKSGGRRTQKKHRHNK